MKLTIEFCSIPILSAAKQFSTDINFESWEVFPENDPEFNIFETPYQNTVYVKIISEDAQAIAQTALFFGRVPKVTSI